MRHLIQKQQFILTIPPGIDPFQAQHEASRFFREQLLPALERIFDELSPEGEVIRLDFCYIDLGAIGAALLRNGRMDEALRQLIAAEVRKMIDKEHAAFPVTRTSTRESVVAVWWYFMEHGRLPWNADELTEDDLQKVLELFSIDYSAITKLRNALKETPRFLIRLVAQHNARFLENLIAVLTSSKQDDLDEAVTQAVKVHRLIDGILKDPRPPSPAAETHTFLRTDTAKALDQWATRMAAFIRAPQIEQKAAIWRLLLTAAAAQPAEFARVGGVAILLQDIPANLPILQNILTSGEFAVSSTSFVIALRQHLRTAAASSAQFDPRLAAPTPDRQPEEPQAPRSEPSASQEEPPATKDQQPDQPDDNDQTNSLKPTPETSPDPASGEKPPGKTIGTTTDKENIVFQRDELTEEGIYIANAGLILLHPFLSTLFHRLGLWNGAAFTDLAARQKAVFLLHFLATGDDHPPEHALLFTKMLCGYSLEMPIPGEIELSEDERAEALALIESAIQRWEKLGSSTVDGLREGFLRRRGKLTNKNGRLSLQMESMGIDILLDYLPWNIHLVKLPWLKDILYVDWR